MRLSSVRFHTPRSVATAIKLLGELEEAHFLAGGTDLLVDIKQGLVQAKHLVSLEKIRSLKTIKQQNSRIVMGAMATLQELIVHPLILKHLPALVDAAGTIGSAQIRSMATAGGNIASAVPSADLPPLLIAADASVRLECIEGAREVSLLGFFMGPRMTVCRDEEILTAICVPIPSPRTGFSYQKFGLREANALAVASAAARITLHGDKTRSAAIVLGAVAPTPVLAAGASDFLLGKVPSEENFKKAAQAAKNECRPISDIRGSAWFRKELIEILVFRALDEAANRAMKKSPRKNKP